MDQARGARVLELSRRVEAPPDRIFSLFTEPSELTAWWGPYGFSTPDIELDLRVGGRYRFTMQPPEGAAFHVTGAFLEIDSPRRLAYTFVYEEPAPDDQETVVALAIDAWGSGSQVRLEQGPFRTEERLALHRQGWAESLDRLRRTLGQERHRAGPGPMAP